MKINEQKLKNLKVKLKISHGVKSVKTGSRLTLAQD